LDLTGRAAFLPNHGLTATLHDSAAERERQPKTKGEIGKARVARAPGPKNRGAPRDPPRKLGHGVSRAGTRRFRDHPGIRGACPAPAPAPAPALRCPPLLRLLRPQLKPMGGGSRALSLSSLCATTLAAAKPPQHPFPFAPASRALPHRLAAAMSSSSSPTPAAPAASGDAGAPAPSASNAIDFLTLCYRLKVSAPRLVASHFRGPA